MYVRHTAFLYTMTHVQTLRTYLISVFVHVAKRSFKIANQLLSFLCTRAPGLSPNYGVYRWTEIYGVHTYVMYSTHSSLIYMYSREVRERLYLINLLLVMSLTGAANLDVVQEVEYVKQENKLPYLLHCLQKTAPPVLIFCENKKDVDDIQEYLLLKGVDAAAVHGGLAQEERSESVRAFR